jgi:hypothetical protein
LWAVSPIWYVLALCKLLVCTSPVGRL